VTGFHASPPVTNFGQTQPDVVRRCKTGESSQNSVSCSVVKTGSWKEPLRFVPAAEGCILPLIGTSDSVGDLGVQGTCSLKPCFTWFLWSWKHSLKFVTTLRMGEFYFFFFVSFSLKSGLIKIYPAYVSVVLFLKDCLLKC